MCYLYGAAASCLNQREYSGEGRLHAQVEMGRLQDVFRPTEMFGGRDLMKSRADNEMWLRWNHGEVQNVACTIGAATAVRFPIGIQ